MEAICKWLREKFKSHTRLRFAGLLAPLGLLFLSSCGTYVPSIPEATGGDIRQTELLVHAIVDAIHCELQTAVSTVVANDQNSAAANHLPRTADFFDTWGVQVNLALTIEEKTVVNPTLAGTFPLSLFTLGIFGNGSTDATRVEKLNYFYMVEDLVIAGPCKANAPKQPHPAGSLLIGSDLKTAEWLASAFLNEGTGSIELKNTSNLQNSSNAISHDIRFEIDTSGGVTPGWKLVPISLNQSGVFFTLSRNRIHEVIFTFGPPQHTPGEAKPTQLAPTAQTLHDANVISSSISNALRNARFR